MNDGDRVILFDIVLCIGPWNIIVWSGCGCDRLLLLFVWGEWRRMMVIG